MKNRVLTLAAFIFLISVCLVSCKKDYQCTCATTAFGVKALKTYEIPKQSEKDATDICSQYEKDINSTDIGETQCHL